MKLDIKSGGRRMSEWTLSWKLIGRAEKEREIDKSC
jgi:hypothetical protein